MTPKSAAQRWLEAFERSDAKRMSAGSALPFTSGGRTVASDAAALRTFFDEMMAEGIPKRDRLHYYTLAEVKARLGRAPRGADGDDVAFAWVEQGGEDLICLSSPPTRVGKWLASSASRRLPRATPRDIGQKHATHPLRLSRCWRQAGPQ